MAQRLGGRIDERVAVSVDMTERHVASTALGGRVQVDAQHGVKDPPWHLDPAGGADPTVVTRRNHEPSQYGVAASVDVAVDPLVGLGTCQVDAHEAGQDSVAFQR